MCVYEQDAISNSLKGAGSWADCNILPQLWRKYAACPVNNQIKDEDESTYSNSSNKKTAKTKLKTRCKRVYLEIGANIGACFLPMIKFDPIKKMHKAIAFEPNPANQFKITKSLLMNGEDSDYFHKPRSSFSAENDGEKRSASEKHSSNLLLNRSKLRKSSKSTRPISYFHERNVQYSKALKKVDLYPFALGATSGKSLRMFQEEGNAGNTVINANTDNAIKEAGRTSIYAFDDIAVSVFGPSYEAVIRNMLFEEGEIKDSEMNAIDKSNEENSEFVKDKNLNILNSGDSDPNGTIYPLHIPVAKIDAQGFEVKILNGAKNFLRTGIVKVWRFELANKWLKDQNTDGCEYFSKFIEAGYQIRDGNDQALTQIQMFNYGASENLVKDFQAVYMGKEYFEMMSAKWKSYGYSNDEMSDAKAGIRPEMSYTEKHLKKKTWLSAALTNGRNAAIVQEPFSCAKSGDGLDSRGKYSRTDGVSWREWYSRIFSKGKK